MTKKTDFSKLPKKDKREEKQFSHLARLIKLLIILQQGVLNLDKAAQECGVSRRTILRDIDILEQGGIPLYKPTKQGANYRLLESFKFSKLQVTKENALQFADMLDAATKFARTPLNLTTPLQKGVLDLGRTEQQKRKEFRSSKNYQFSPAEISEEQFFSAFLQEQHEEKTPPYFTIMMLSKMGKLFEKEERLSWYIDWQKKYIERVSINLFYIGQNYKRVLEECKKIIKKEPKDTWAYKQAALACYAKNDIKGALLYLLNALDYNKKDAEVYAYLAFFSLKIKDYEKAIFFFKLACDDSVACVHFASSIYADAGLFDKALNEIDKAAQKDPIHAKLYADMKQDVLAKKNGPKDTKQEEK